ncbi:hypothetical protein Pst134EA_011797 [Puccinia striiformis f. sp. tritici]|uniref:hypothetical protein n=1 Tax=Puccinia striiformis f. sp. tritici TaxID=168172 RepID=UPI0020083C7D|nr:hypothetical protein Pst134EA_011797 [Puccinia striiformis f. sp. tritici]KAH9468173.1 hypothetical protein Pst134EA_011797 [Puccinia striiformis f. sp. tritici]
MMDNFSKILVWSMEAGIEEITFTTNAIELIQYLANIPTFIKRKREHIMGVNRAQINRGRSQDALEIRNHL